MQALQYPFNVLGIIGGELYNHYGGGSNYLCLPRNPKYDKYQNGHQSGGRVYGTEYQIYGYNGNLFDKNLHNSDAPCAVCFVKSRGSMLMMPARNDCPSGWIIDYHGYLMTCLLYTSPSPRDLSTSRMPSSA